MAGGGVSPPHLPFPRHGPAASAGASGPVSPSWVTRTAAGRGPAALMLLPDPGFTNPRTGLARRTGAPAAAPRPSSRCPR